MTKYLPIIKVLDMSTIDIPKRITILRRDNGKLWWKYTDAIPTIQHNLSKIHISSSRISDRYESYKFTQCLFNLLLYNNLQLDRPQKFKIDELCDNTISFTYFIDEEEIISIPIMPQHSHSLKFTLFDNYPVLILKTNQTLN